MEDFVREIGRGSALFLLYGDTGVGKTSLLKQLTTQRLTELTSHWIDFNESDDAENLESIAESANEDDVIVVDHFESASNRAQHQIFKSWSTDGRDKRLNIIVSTTSSSFNAFRQLAQQYQVEAQSFQLMPCMAEEVESYLQFVLFPNEPFGQLKISPTVRKQVRSARGVFTKLNEIIGREGDAFSLEASEYQSSGMRVGLVSGLFMLVLVAAGLVYYFHLPSPPVIIEQEVQTPAPEVEQIEVPLESSPPEVVEIIEVIEEPEQSTIVEVDWFQVILEQSMEWIKQGDPQRGTIQIMSIGFSSFDQTAYRGYLDRLKSDNVDIDKIKIFKTRAGSQVVYSIIYGEYENRGEAGRQITALPESLGADGPISRTTGSIVSEIEKFGEI